MLHFHKQGLKSSYLILLFLLQFTCPLFPQLLLRGVAPLAPGNYWKYLITNDGIGYIDSVSFLVKDSVVNINNREFFVIQVKDVITYDIYCGLGTDSFYVRYDENGEDSLYKYLKYNCHIGDTWSQHHSSNTIIFSVVDSFQVNAWGENYIAKEIYLTSDNSFLQMHFLWTDSLGLLSEFSESEYTAGLAGCVINDQLYGDTAMYVTSVNDFEQHRRNLFYCRTIPTPSIHRQKSLINYRILQSLTSRFTISWVKQLPL